MTESTVELSSGEGNRAVINTQGARIEVLELDGARILRPVVRGSGKLGSTHPCSPNFGPDTIYGLPQHGPVRNELWRINYQRGQKLQLACTIRHRNFPEGLKIVQSFILDRNFLMIRTDTRTTAPIATLR